MCGPYRECHLLPIMINADQTRRMRALRRLLVRRNDGTRARACCRAVRVGRVEFALSILDFLTGISARNHHSWPPKPLGRNTMSMFHARLAISVAVIGLLPTAAMAAQTPFFFSTGDPDGKIATASRPDTGGSFEIEFRRRFRSHPCDVHHQRVLHRAHAGRREP